MEGLLRTLEFVINRFILPVFYVLSRFFRLLKHPLISGVGSLVIGTIILYHLGLIQAGPTLQTSGSVPGAIQTVGQTGGTNLVTDGVSTQQLRYSGMAVLDPFGQQFTSDGSLEFHSETSDLLKPYIFIDDKRNLNWTCTPLSVAAYTRIIKDFPLFPFAYFYLGTCEANTKPSDAQENIKTAESILRVTTSIEGHNANHDTVLKMIEDKAYKSNQEQGSRGSF